MQPGVKMATAVSAYKFENNGYQSAGKLGLAIIGRDSLIDFFGADFVNSSFG